MNITASLFALSQLESMKKKIEADKLLQEVTEEDERQRKNERSSEKEKKLPKQQGVEGVQAQKECGAEGDRPNNEKEAMQGSESAPQKPKRGRVRKH